MCIIYRVAAGWSSSVARRAHNPEVVGSNPAPATNRESVTTFWLRIFSCSVAVSGKSTKLRTPHP